MEPCHCWSTLVGRRLPVLLKSYLMSYLILQGAWLKKSHRQRLRQPMKLRRLYWQLAKRRKNYVKLTDAQRLQIGKKTSEIRIAAEIRFYKSKVPDLGQLLMEPTVCWLKNWYNDELKRHNEKLRKRPRRDTDSDEDSSKDPGELLELPSKKREATVTWGQLRQTNPSLP